MRWWFPTLRGSEGRGGEGVTRSQERASAPAPGTNEITRHGRGGFAGAGMGMGAGMGGM